MTMSANARFGIMVLGTLALVALLVAGGAKKEQRAGAGTPVDIQKVERQVQEGNLGLRRAEFQRQLNSPEDAQ